MSIIRDWAAFVGGAKVTTLPPGKQAAQRRHVADTLIAAVAGSRTNPNSAVDQSTISSPIRERCWKSMAPA